MVGLGAVWITMKLIQHFLVHIHGITLIVFFAVYASLAMLNHTHYDIELPWYLLGYAVKAHETHHRFPTGKNYYC